METQDRIVDFMNDKLINCISLLHL